MPYGSVDEKRCSFSQDFVKYFDIYVLCQVDIHSEYDLVQLIGEGWYSRVYLAEHRTTRDEVVLKAINSNLVTADEFCREYQSSINLWPHKNILKVKVVNDISRSTFFGEVTFWCLPLFESALILSLLSMKIFLDKHANF